MPEVAADEDRSERVLTHLVGNALRYRPAGGQVTVKVRPFSGAVEFAVSDTGIGVAPEHLLHLFERFFQVGLSRMDIEARFHPESGRT